MLRWTDERLPAWLRRVLERGLAADPAARYPSMDALLDALERRHLRTYERWGLRGLGAAGLAARWASSENRPPIDRPTWIGRTGLT